MNRIKASGRQFTDEFERERIFYGFNYGFKGAVLSETDKYFNNEKCLCELKQRGFNVFRLIMTWSVLEPQPGQYNEKAFSDIAVFLDLAEKYGFYVVLDMHQDLFGSYNVKPGVQNPSNGAPQWACLTGGHKYHIPKIVWASGYFTGKAVHSAFDNFWHNRPAEGKGLQEHFCDLWIKLAERFGEHPAVMGFDLFNEPFNDSDGKIFKSIVKGIIKTTLLDKRIKKSKLFAALFEENTAPKLLEQYNSEILKTITKNAEHSVNEFDTKLYSEFLNKTSSAIRSVNKSKIIFFEHSYYSNLGIPFSGGPVEVNGKRDNAQAFAPHAYDLFVDTKLYKYANNERVGAIFAQRKAEQTDRLDMPVLVGEWGGAGIIESWTEHAEYLLDLFDSYKWSSCYWMFFPNLFELKTMETLSRTHPIAVCGKIISYGINRKSNCFHLEFEQEREYEVPTEIYYSKPFKSIEANAEYKTLAFSEGRGILKFKTAPGRNKITIQF